MVLIVIMKTVIIKVDVTEASDPRTMIGAIVPRMIATTNTVHQNIYHQGIKRDRLIVGPVHLVHTKVPPAITNPIADQELIDDQINTLRETISIAAQVQVHLVPARVPHLNEAADHHVLR